MEEARTPRGPLPTIAPTGCYCPAEAAVGGTIGLVEEGDSITVDANKLLIQLNVEDRELARRRKDWKKPKPRYKTGILGKYSRLVSSSSQGATTDQI